MGHSRDKHLPPAPHMARCAEWADHLKRQQSEDDKLLSYREQKIYAFMREFSVDWDTACQLVENDSV